MFRDLDVMVLTQDVPEYGRGAGMSVRSCTLAVTAPPSRWGSTPRKAGPSVPTPVLERLGVKPLVKQEFRLLRGRRLACGLRK